MSSDTFLLKRAAYKTDQVGTSGPVRVRPHYRRFIHTAFLLCQYPS
jgi:hypothetical protein